MDILGKLGYFSARWDDSGLVVLDQRQLPASQKYLTLKSVDEVAESIRNMTVRGAPLIGIVAAYGLCLVGDPSNDGQFVKAGEKLITARPTAVNLAWAVNRMTHLRDQNKNNPDLRELLLVEARRIHDEDAEACRKIGEFGNSMIPEKCGILTHCNTGALATGGIGTALGIIFTAHFSGKKIQVWVDETRPVLQGSRLTAWELAKAGVPYKLIVDNMAGRLMADGEIDLVVTGADRIARNLDFANKTGTYSLAVLANYHHIPFYCAAPLSTFDRNAPDGRSVKIEFRPENEIRGSGNILSAPAEAPVYNPAFDITPRDLVTGFISEKGIIDSDSSI